MYYIHSLVPSQRTVIIFLELFGGGGLGARLLHTFYKKKTGSGDWERGYTALTPSPPLLHSQLEDCRRLLVGIFESPLLSRHNTIAYHLTARAKAVTAHYLQHSRWTLKPGNEFLQYLLSEHCEPLESGSFRLTPLELYADAARLCRGLANSSSVSVPLSTSNQDLSNEYENQGHPSPAALSPQASAWSILHELFSSLRSLARTYLVQGGVREAHCYAREGLVLAKSLLLQGW